MGPRTELPEQSVAVCGAQGERVQQDLGERWAGGSGGGHAHPLPTPAGLPARLPARLHCLLQAVSPGLEITAEACGPEPIILIPERLLPQTPLGLFWEIRV